MDQEYEKVLDQQFPQNIKQNTCKNLANITQHSAEGPLNMIDQIYSWNMFLLQIT